MAKFYIKSGNLKYIIDKANHKDAIVAALQYAQKKHILTGLRVCWSEKGFITFKEWICEDVEDYLKEI